MAASASRHDGLRRKHAGKPTADKACVNHVREGWTFRPLVAMVLPHLRYTKK